MTPEPEEVDRTFKEDPPTAAVDKISVSLPKVMLVGAPGVVGATALNTTVAILVGLLMKFCGLEPTEIVTAIVPCS